MKPYYQDHHVTLYNKDCRSMDEIPDNSVHCIITSPPYYGLRRYEGGEQIWGGEPDCEHEWGEKIIRKNRGSTGKTVSVGANKRELQGNQTIQGNICSKCGAWRGQLGAEPSPELYIQHLIGIMREIRRVLRKDGVVFWNIGDSYATHASGGKGYAHNFRSADIAVREGIDQPKPSAKSIGLKEKDLCLIPLRIAITAQKDGWWVRSVIIWSKNNPMPESVTDRPTESHEYILMLTKSAHYYWDMEAVREKIAESTIGRGPVEFGGSKGRDYKPDKFDPNYRAGSEQWGRTYDYTESSTNGRNIRSVWTFPTQPYSGAHFAVFPEKLPEICIKASTSEKGCRPECGAPWARVVKVKQHARHKTEPADLATDGDGANQGKHAEPTESKTIGWRPTCKCNAREPVPCTVLDPFAGSGTTLWVAKKLNRRSVGYEISEKYCRLSIERNRQQVIL